MDCCDRISCCIIAIRTACSGGVCASRLQLVSSNSSAKHISRKIFTSLPPLPFGFHLITNDCHTRVEVSIKSAINAVLRSYTIVVIFALRKTDAMTSETSASTPTPNRQASSALVIGASLITSGFLANTIQGALGKTAQASIAPGQFLWLLLLLALTVLLPVGLWREPRILQSGWSRQILPFYLLRAVFGLCGFYLFIWSAGLGSLVDATVLLNTTPVFIPLIGVLVLNKEISSKLWGAIALGFAGLLLVVQPNAELIRNPANLLGLGAGLSAAVEFLTVRWLSDKQSSLSQTLYYLILGTLLLSPIALWQWQPLNLEIVKVILAAAGAFLTFQILLVKAYSFAEPHQIGVFQYSSVIFAALIGWLFFSEVPNTMALIGMVLIIIGGALSIYLEQKPATATEPSTTESSV